MTTKISKSDPAACRPVRGAAHLGALCVCLGASLLAASCGDALVDACACCVDVVSEWFQRWTDPAAWFDRHVTR